MNNNERELLLKDLGARIGGIVYMGNKSDNTFYPLWIDDLKDVDFDEEFDDVPFLRAMEDATQEESLEIYKTLYIEDMTMVERMVKLMDMFNEHHFDYRGLIEKGLAIRVTDENNPYKY